MFLSVNRLPHPIPPSDKPDPKAAQALQEGLGGQFGEMRTMMQYFFQNMNFRGDAKQYQDLLRSIATEEMGHVEQITNTINMLLEGASKTSQQPNDLPLSVALDSPNIHHFLVAAQSARPVDAAGNPWSATYVYDSGNLVLNMIYNLMLEATGRLQKCRLYEMSNNKAYRSTVSYLIVGILYTKKYLQKHLRLWVSTGAKHCQFLGLIHQVCQRLEIWKERIFTTKCGLLQTTGKQVKLARYSKEIHPLTTVAAN